jgi:heme-degrading monooxygenase HmoA
MAEVEMPEIRAENQPVTQITIVEPEPGKLDEAFSLMSERARFMARQPGFVSISLHKSLDRKRIVNYIQWESRDLLRKAHKHPEFRKEWTHLGGVTEEIDPHLFEVAEVMEAKH